MTRYWSNHNTIFISSLYYFWLRLLITIKYKVHYTLVKVIKYVLDSSSSYINLFDIKRKVMFYTFAYQVSVWRRQLLRRNMIIIFIFLLYKTYFHILISICAYFRCSCWDKLILTKNGQTWTNIRTTVLSVVDTPAFEWFILVLIFASSITLCFEDIYLDQNPTLKFYLYWTNMFFCVVFVIEMCLKWIALGFAKYFTSFWTILDFIIVFVSGFEL